MPDKNTIVRVLILIVTLVNAVLAFLGKTELSIDENTFYTLATIISTVGASLWTMWKNNSFTEAAKKADEYLKKLKGSDAESEKANEGE